MASSQRLLSLDILRGITVAGMILVNNGWGESFEMLRHSKWNGMTPCDLVSRLPLLPLHHGYLVLPLTGEVGVQTHRPRYPTYR